MKIRNSVINGILYGCAGTCLAAWVPHDTQWMLDVDMQALNASRIGSLVAERVQRERPVVFEKVRVLTAAAGVNLQRDVTALTVCGTGWAASSTVSRVTGNQAFTQICRDRLGTALAVSSYGPYELFDWSKGPHRFAISQPDPGTLIVAESARVKSVLDVYAGRRAACDLARFRLFATSHKSSLVRFEVHDVATLFQHDSSPYGLVLRFLNTLDCVVSETNDQVRLIAHGVAATPEGAQQAAQVLQGVLALVQLKETKSSSLRSALRAIQVEQEGTLVRCQIALTIDQVQALLNDDRPGSRTAVRR